MIDLTLIKRFCGRTANRPALHEPWVCNGRLIATDGKVLLETDVPAGFERSPLPDPPPVDGVLKKFTTSAEWKRCPTAKATGDCWYCNGTKERTCDCGYKHPCEQCSRTGKNFDIQFGIVIGAGTFSHHYLHLLNQLPNCEVSPTTEALGVLSFRFDGGRGLLMPLRRGT